MLVVLVLFGCVCVCGVGAEILHARGWMQFMAGIDKRLDGCFGSIQWPTLLCLRRSVHLQAFDAAFRWMHMLGGVSSPGQAPLIAQYRTGIESWSSVVGDEGTYLPLM